VKRLLDEGHAAADVAAAILHHVVPIAPPGDERDEFSPPPEGRRPQFRHRRPPQRPGRGPGEDRPAGRRKVGPRAWKKKTGR
jgi:hypothetical protein